MLRRAYLQLSVETTYETILTFSFTSSTISEKSVYRQLWIIDPPRLADQPWRTAEQETQPSNSRTHT